MNFNFSVRPRSRTKQELNNKGWYTLVELERPWNSFFPTTDHPVVTIDYLITSAMSAVKFGLSEEVASKAITVRADEHLGIEELVGSLSQGKDGDNINLE